MALVQEKALPPPRHRPPRVEMRHVIDMTQVDGDPGSAGTATTEEEENAFGVAGAEDESQRQVFPEDLLHALATLETFRHLAAAGIDNELGLAVGTIRHMACLDSVSSTLHHCKRDTDDSHNSAGVNGIRSGQGESGVESEIEVNLDGKVPERATFKSDDVMFDIKIEPLVAFLETLTNPDHLQKVREILDKASTPFDYYRIDERINESYLPPGHETRNAATSWLAANRGPSRTAVPNVPIVRELRIDITTLHPSAIYRLEQFRRRQLKIRVLPMRMDMFVDEKEPEWIKQRMKAKRLARKVEMEKQRIRMMEEREREHAATVRRHLRMSSGARRGRRHSDDTSERSSEMSPVPSNVSSPSPPPPQIFHEVQESVPFPFQASSPVQQMGHLSAVPPTDSSPLSPCVSPEVSKNQISPLTVRKSLPASQPTSMSIPSSDPSKPLPRLKIKFKGASLLTSKIAAHNDNNKDKAVTDKSSHSSTPTITAENDLGLTADVNHAKKGTPALLISKPPFVEHQNLSASASPSITKAVPPHQSETTIVLSTGSDEVLATRNNAQSPRTDADLPQSVDRERAPSIPRATQDVISQMEVALTDQQLGNSREEAIDVDIDVDVIVLGEVKNVTPKVPASDEGRLGTLGVSAQVPTEVEKQDRSDSPIKPSSDRRRLDEEDEALVEELEGLDAISRDDSTGGSVRAIGESAPPSAGSLVMGKVPDRFPETGHMAVGPGAAQRLSSMSLQTTASPSLAVPTTIPLKNQPCDASSSAQTINLGEIGGAGEPRMEMVIDDELEPVSVQDTQARAWNYKGDQSNSSGKGMERMSIDKRKGKAKDLSIRICDSQSSSSDDNSKWTHSARVMQVKGITGPTATDTESPSADSPDTPSLSPQPTSGPAESTVVIAVPATPNTATGLASPVSASARLSLERRRQNETLYAALAANFLNRCGSASQPKALYNPRIDPRTSTQPQAAWYTPSQSNSRTSGTPPEQHLLPQGARMTTCDPRDVFGKAESVDDLVQGQVKGETAAKEAENGAPMSDPRESGEDRLSDDDLVTNQADEIIVLSPVEPAPMEVAVDETPVGNTSRVVEVPEEEEADYQVVETTYHRAGRSTRNKRKHYTDMVPIDEISPLKRPRPSRRSRTAEIVVVDHDDEPVFMMSGRNPWTDPTDLEVVIPIRRRPFSPSPPPQPRQPRPNLKIILNLGPYRH